ncbi:cadmium-translocating P-type ATPase [Oscillospiraceae bacterium HV4-5-C5C]|nr:cadmium-translocating P-type ATPase [Oscillospiraceae bacterium HV4-5-C5C]
MKQAYILDGLDCASCADKIERAARKLDGVQALTVNFVTETLEVESDGRNPAKLQQDLVTLIQRLEPEVKVVPKDQYKANQKAGTAAHACGCSHSSGAEGGQASHPAEAAHSHDHHHDHDHDHDLSPAANGAAADEAEEDGFSRSILLKLISGAVLFVAAMLLQRLTRLPEVVPDIIYIISYLILGFSVLKSAGRNLIRGQIFDENFLMSVATIGALALGDFSEAVAVMLFYQIGELFEDAAVNRSRHNIKALMDIRPDVAMVNRGGNWQSVSPDSVAIGEHIRVQAGERIPLDGTLLSGQALLDTSALTGESMPREAKPGDSVLSGCINTNGLLEIEVSKAFGESTVNKIIDMVENASSKKANSEQFITTFSRYYTPAVVGMAVLLALLPPLLTGGNFSEWIHRALIFLVISCPCALVLSVPLSFFAGIGAASRQGVLVKGGNYLEALSKLDTVAFDKTGTLTQGVFELRQINPAEGVSQDELLHMAAAAESSSTHPIAQSILKANHSDLSQDRLENFENLAGRGLKVRLNGQEILAGNLRLMQDSGIAVTPLDGTGTHVYVARDGRLAGSLVIDDALKADSPAAICLLKARGVRHIVMLTGDNRKTADAVAAQLGVDAAASELLPDQKVSELEKLAGRTGKGKLAFVGDGINDAPVLARADIGIAMGGLGSDAAIEAADVVLMTDEPTKLATAIDVARATHKIVIENISFALGVKGLFLLLGALGIIGMWAAVFADVGVTLIAIINSMRLLRWKPQQNLSAGQNRPEQNTAYDQEKAA